jgi:hypothetical protein
MGFVAPSGGPEQTFTREELLRIRNGTVKKDTELEPESQDCNEQESEPDESND